MAEGRLTGAEKAAVLLMYVGEDLASEVFKHLNPAEMQKIAGTIVKKDYLSMKTGKEVLNEFLRSSANGEIAVEGMEFAKSVITRALGAEKAQYLLDHLNSELGGGTGIESLKWLEPTVLANIVKNEHPQISAIILAHLTPERASQVLLSIPDDRVKGEIMLRVANLQKIPQAAVKDLEALLADQMFSSETNQGSTVEGIKIAAEILNSIDQNIEAGVMENIAKISPDTATRIQEKMFVFTDLLTVDDRGMQMIIKELNTEVLSVALKAAEAELKERFFKNMSERAAEMLKEDIESKGPVKLSEVERSQQEIIKVARKLEQEGKVARAGKSGEVFV